MSYSGAAAVTITGVFRELSDGEDYSIHFDYRERATPLRKLKC